jgi:hypothetical protein
MITNKIDDLHSSVNDIYEQFDEGDIDFNEAEQILMRVCKNFLFPRPDFGQALDHTIRFDDVDSMVLWLLENNVDDAPVSLTIHLGE